MFLSKKESALLIVIVGVVLAITAFGYHTLKCELAARDATMSKLAQEVCSLKEEPQLCWEYVFGKVGDSNDTDNLAQES